MLFMWCATLLFFFFFFSVSARTIPSGSPPPYVYPPPLTRRPRCRYREFVAKQHSMLREVKNDTEQVDALRLDLTALRGQLDHVVRTTSPRPDWKEGCTHYPELTQCLKVRIVVQM